MYDIPYILLTLICPNNVTQNNFLQTSGTLSISGQTENKRCILRKQGKNVEIKQFILFINVTK